MYHRSSLWGQIDYWTSTIRIYSNRTDSDILHTICHEMIHGISYALNLKIDDEDTVDLLAIALSDTLTRNGWLKDEL
jgi:hypothetical protein